MPHRSLFGLGEPSRGAAQTSHALEILAAADASVVVTQIVARLGTWTDAFGPPFTRANITPCTLWPGYGMAWMPAADLLLVARAAVWQSVLDNWADDLRGSPDDEVVGVLDRCRAVVRGSADGGSHVLTQALAEIRDAVRERRPSDAMYRWWQEENEAFLVAMQFERQVAAGHARGQSPPSVESYLAHATRSIGIPSGIITCWSCMPWHELSAHLPELREALTEAALVTRLANDLRGHERECRDGAVDAITLGMSAEEVGTLLAASLRRCREILAPLILGSCDGAVALERTMLWVLRVYQRDDAGHLDEPIGSVDER